MVLLPCLDPETVSEHLLIWNLSQNLKQMNTIQCTLTFQHLTYRNIWHTKLTIFMVLGVPHNYYFTMKMLGPKVFG